MNRALLFLSLAAVLTQGCVRVNKYNYTVSQTIPRSATAAGASSTNSPDLMVLEYHCRTGFATLENDRVQLVFMELNSTEGKVMNLENNELGIQVAGPGAATMRRSCRRNLTSVELSSSYADGTNTLQLDRCSVKFIDGGKALLVDGQTVPLTNGQRTVELTRRRAKVR